ncbi:hypothetical protein MTBBW1_2560031 [Desulfamplus magnetovallimortis]|uniref:Uncharacterized protein n=2 Tax=Desulfamplus magnetovallimortis TaxID=1246637 RepID=A0A1W1HEU6_9BACT|nr:hypothetical protein MTBBW1_2560031 [Desulfamplus magnetovallimortis]
MDTLTIQNVSLEEYILEKYPDNPIVNHLGEGDYDTAQNRLFNIYGSYGIVEHFNESLIKIANITPKIKINHNNIALNATKKISIDIPQKLKEIFMKNQDKDLSLYLEAYNRMKIENSNSQYATISKHIESHDNVKNKLKQNDYYELMSYFSKNIKSLTPSEVGLAVQLSLELNNYSRAEKFLVFAERKFPQMFFRLRIQLLSRTNKFTELSEYINNIISSLNNNLLFFIIAMTILYQYFYITTNF